MALATRDFRATSGVRALLEQVYDVKFSKHTPLIVVLLSMIYTVFRSADYLAHTFSLPWLVTWPTAIFIELLVLATSAAVFIALRAAYIAELKQQDADRAKWGVYVGFAVLFLAFLALLFVAGADAWQVTQAVIPSAIMVLIQASQMLLLIGFIIAADLDEREKLRIKYADHKRNEVQAAANQCPHCFREVSSNNRARHIASCPARIQREA